MTEMKMPRVAVIGRGYLGLQIAAALGANHYGRAETGDLRALVSLADVVINAAGACGSPNVDALEGSPNAATRDNVQFPLELARVCAARGARLIHISSGCIFSWGYAVTEDEHPTPTNVYTRSKAAADLALQSFSDVAIVRVRMPLGAKPHRRNLLTKLAGYERVCHAVNSVTVVEDLCLVLAWLAAHPEQTGVFHAVNQGVIAHKDILSQLELAGVHTRAVSYVAEAELGLKVARSHVTLANTRIPPALLPPITQRLPEIARAYSATIWEAGERALGVRP